MARLPEATPFASGPLNPPLFWPTRWAPRTLPGSMLARQRFVRPVRTRGRETAGAQLGHLGQSRHLVIANRCGGDPQLAYLQTPMPLVDGFFIQRSAGLYEEVGGVGIEGELVL